MASTFTAKHKVTHYYEWRSEYDLAEVPVGDLLRAIGEATSTFEKETGIRPSGPNWLNVCWRGGQLVLSFEITPGVEPPF